MFITNLLSLIRTCRTETWFRDQGSCDRNFQWSSERWGVKPAPWRPVGAPPSFGEKFRLWHTETAPTDAGLPVIDPNLCGSYPIRKWVDHLVPWTGCVRFLDPVQLRPCSLSRLWIDLLITPNFSVRTCAFFRTVNNISWLIGSQGRYT